jgi:Restriction endonuclease
MTNIRSIDMLFLDDLFEMGGGYVLKFSDKTFAQFFAEELNLDINNEIYSRNGTSKGKRLRHFLQISDKKTVIKTLNALWEYREALRLRNCEKEKIENAHSRFLILINKIGGNSNPHSELKINPGFDSQKLDQIKNDLVALASYAPHPRGYAFEKFLKELFDAYGLEPKAPYRLNGEQIDGSFQLGNETYLLEAKWQNPRIGNAELGAFHSKLDQKAVWARGLFISNSGFTDEGLHAFGRGRRIVCMDGFDLHETLEPDLKVVERYQ